MTTSLLSPKYQIVIPKEVRQSLQLQPGQKLQVVAKDGHVELLDQEIKKKKAVVNAKDENGWTPLHEGARGGHLEVVKLLVENGADLSARTAGDGGTALWWAKQEYDENHPVVKFLEEIGALDVGPEL